MNDKLKLIHNEAKLTLLLTDGHVYGRIINMMMKTITNPTLLEMYKTMKYQIAFKYFEEGKTPEELSMQYFGVNIFEFDVFDYYLMAYVLFQDELKELFHDIELTHKLTPDYYIHKNNILSIFDEQPKYMHRSGKNYPYKTILFQDFLEERNDWIAYLEKEIKILEEIVNE